MYELLPGYKLAMKCCDKNEPISPSHKPGRGHHGVAIAWKETIDRYVIPLHLGSERLLAIEINNCDTAGTTLGKLLEMFS